MPERPTGTVTFLFTDIEGSTRLAREHAETWEASRARHHQILREAIETNHGLRFKLLAMHFVPPFIKRVMLSKLRYRLNRYYKRRTGEIA